MSSSATANDGTRSDAISVRIADREYFCLECKRTHRYHDADGLYHAHEGRHDGNRRWVTKGEPSRHPSSERFHELLRELGALHDRKQADYGTVTDPFANLRDSAGFGVAPWLGAVIRLNDKVNRVKSMAVNGKLMNEGVEDSLRDIAVYAAIALVLYEEGSSGRTDGDGAV